jgi:hypothetical protein
MSAVLMTSSMSSSTAAAEAVQRAARSELLREKVGEFVGLTFYGTLLQTAQRSPLKGKYGHGGRGEEVFRSQLNLELARQAGRAGRLGIDEAIYKRLAAAYEREAGGDG